MNLILKFNVIFNLINFKLRLIFNFKFKDTVKQLNKINLNIKKVKDIFYNYFYFYEEN